MAIRVTDVKGAFTFSFTGYIKSLKFWIKLSLKLACDLGRLRSQASLKFLLGYSPIIKL